MDASLSKDHPAKTGKNGQTDRNNRDAFFSQYALYSENNRLKGPVFLSLFFSKR